jgi:hypothetical protein
MLILAGCTNNALPFQLAKLIAGLSPRFYTAIFFAIFGAPTLKGFSTNARYLTGF